MSTINVTNLSGRGGASPNLPDGANVTGVLTATSFVGSGANLTGLASTDFINAEQVTVVGVVTAGTGNIGNVNLTKSAGGVGATVGSYTGVTTYYGDGSSLTGAGDSIAPHYYNPDVGDIRVTVDTGIGITFNKKVEAGSGTATLKIVNAGVAGTTIQSWGVSSSTYNVTALTLGALVSDLLINQTYQIDIPEGFAVDTSGTSYVGTAYTFVARGAAFAIWTWGRNEVGNLGLNDVIRRSSPTQIAGATNWANIQNSTYPDSNETLATRTDGTLWSWGSNNVGQLGQNDVVYYSSPIQIGSGTDWHTGRYKIGDSYASVHAIKTDGTMYAWGANQEGQLGQNQAAAQIPRISSPIQIPGTTWSKLKSGYQAVLATKTDGTLWSWGDNQVGELGLNQPVSTKQSSPTQIPGTNWATPIMTGPRIGGCIKTDGTLWVWGYGSYGQLGLNDRTQRSSPTQIPGTTWEKVVASNLIQFAKKTDGTLWSWGYNKLGELGQNNRTHYSSPVQIPGTTWTDIASTAYSGHAIKTDGTLWSWGYNNQGQLGYNNRADRSSPTQIGSHTDWHILSGGDYFVHAQRKDETP